MKKHLILAGVFFILFLLVTYLTVTNKLATFDTTVYNFLINMRNDSLDNYFKLLTRLGNTLTVVLIMSGFLVIMKKHDRINLFLILVSSTILNRVIKAIIKRPRPEHLRIITEKGFSYPSGHATAAIALYGFLLYLVYGRVQNKYLKVFLMIVLIYIILTIGLSRIYLGVHYPSDILGGYLLSIVVLFLAKALSDKFNYQKQ